MTMQGLLAILFPYRTHLEFELRQQHEDFLRLYDNQAANYKERIAEKDAEIRRLRAELATGRVVLEPARPRITEVPTMVPDAPMDWQSELNKMLADEEAKIDETTAGD